MIDQSATIGAPSAVGLLKLDDASNQTRMISAGNTLRLRRSPTNWGVICLIDQIQREHAALAAAEVAREQAAERAREEAEDIQAGLRHQHPLG